VGVDKEERMMWEWTRRSGRWRSGQGGAGDGGWLGRQSEKGGRARRGAHVKYRSHVEIVSVVGAPVITPASGVYGERVLPLVMQ